MNAKPDGVVIENNEVEQQYEMRIDGHLAVSEYVLLGERIILSHTEVPRELEGRGLGSQLVRFALDDARARHLSVIPRCPFVSAYIQRHPEYMELVDPDYRSRLKAD